LAAFYIGFVRVSIALDKSRANEYNRNMLQDNQLQNLTENERAALKDLVTRLHRRYGDDLERVVLFGSKARGDFDAESDLDVLVVVRFPEEEYREQWQQIVDLAWKAEFEHGVVTSLIVKTPAEYNKMQRERLLLYRNIERDGVTLWTLQPDTLMYKSV